MDSSANVLQSYFSSIRPGAALSRETEHQLAHQARSGETEALDRLIRAHVGVIVRVANGYRNRGLPLEDLVAEGILGVMEAVQRFDPGRNTKFITYAVWWIRRCMVKALAEGASLVRVPRYRSRQFKDARRAASEDHGDPGHPDVPILNDPMAVGKTEKVYVSTDPSVLDGWIQVVVTVLQAPQLSRLPVYPERASDVWNPSAWDRLERHPDDPGIGVCRGQCHAMGVEEVIGKQHLGVRRVVDVTLCVFLYEPTTASAFCGL